MGFCKFCSWIILLGILFMSMLGFDAIAEMSIPEINDITINEEIFDEIRNQVDLPRDYDINRAIKGMNYLVNEENFSIAGAAGLIGNGYAESRLLINPGKGFYKGLFQWDGKYRWPKVKEYLEDNEVDFEDEEQLYLWQLSAALNSDDAENYQNVIDYCKDSEKAEDSAEKWCLKFEGTKQALRTRKKIAKLTVQMYEVYLTI